MSAYGFLPQTQGPQPAGHRAWSLDGQQQPHATNSGQRQDFFSSDGPGEVWHTFLSDYMRGKPVAEFERPSKGLVQETTDAYSGGRPGPWTRDTVSEWYIQGTEPSSQNPIDPPGLLYNKSAAATTSIRCRSRTRERRRHGSRRTRTGPAARREVRAWHLGEFGTRTAHLRGQSSWGGPILQRLVHGTNPESAAQWRDDAASQRISDAARHAPATPDADAGSDTAPLTETDAQSDATAHWDTQAAQDAQAVASRSRRRTARLDIRERVDDVRRRACIAVGRPCSLGRVRPHPAMVSCRSPSRPIR